MLLAVTGYENMACKSDPLHTHPIHQVWAVLCSVGHNGAYRAKVIMSMQMLMQMLHMLKINCLAFLRVIGAKQKRNNKTV